MRHTIVAVDEGQGEDVCFNVIAAVLLEDLVYDGIVRLSIHHGKCKTVVQRCVHVTVYFMQKFSSKAVKAECDVWRFQLLLVT
jgi:hypothetical protein